MQTQKLYVYVGRFWSIKRRSTTINAMAESNLEESLS